MKFFFMFLLGWVCVFPSYAVELQIDNDLSHVQDELDEKENSKAVNFRKEKALTKDEMSQVWHLSEGADMYPLAWMIRLRSTTLNSCGDRNPGTGPYFLDNLDDKIGATWDPIPSKYPVRYIGLTAAWSSMRPDASVDFNSGYHAYPETEVQLPGVVAAREEWRSQIKDWREQGSEIDHVKILTDAQSLPEETETMSKADWQKWVAQEHEQKSIAMSGTNCTFCHSGSIAKPDGGQVIVDGMPGVVSSGDFFTDLTLSTIRTMLNPESLNAFLVSFPSVVSRYAEMAPKMLKEEQIQALQDQFVTTTLSPNNRPGNIIEINKELQETIDLDSLTPAQAKEKALENIAKMSKSFAATYRLALLGPDLETGIGIVDWLIKRKKKKIQESAQECTEWSARQINKRGVADDFKYALYKNRDVTKHYLEKLVELTFDFSQTGNAYTEVDKLRTDRISKTVKSKMEWIAYVTGYNQEVVVGHDGNGDEIKVPLERAFQARARTDAFGRVGNWLLPYDKQTHINAPASDPYMWGMQYRPMYNYPGNTNSVVIRNLLQSIGLGATLPWFDRDSDIKDLEAAQTTSPWVLFATTNLHVMNRIEELLYKMQIPSYYSIFGAKDVEPSYSWIGGAGKDYYLERDTHDQEVAIEVPEVEIEQAIDGCNIYQNTCAHCHDSKGSQVVVDYNPRVGPGHDKMIAEQVFPLDVVGTDPQHAHQMARVIVPDPETVPEDERFWAGGLTFSEFAWPAFTLVENAYYDRWVPETNDLQKSVIADWRRTSMRGGQVIRDGDYRKDDIFSMDDNGERFLSDLGSPMAVQTTEQETNSIIPEYARGLKEPRHYIARHLSGIWATAPFLHNGSIPTIMQLLLPEEKRLKYFMIGSNDYDHQELGFKYRFEDHRAWNLPKSYSFDFDNRAGGRWGTPLSGRERGAYQGEEIAHAEEIAKICRLHQYECFFTEEFEDENLEQKETFDFPSPDLIKAGLAYSGQGYYGMGNTLVGNSTRGHSGPGFTGWGYNKKMLDTTGGIERSVYKFSPDGTEILGLDVDPEMEGIEHKQDYRDFTQKERKALISFLKVLQPEAEYAWNTVPVYKVKQTSEGRVCERNPIYAK